MIPIEIKFPQFTHQGIKNHLRSKYKGDIELAYLTELGEQVKKCEYCSSNAKFMGLFKGYHQNCGSKECIKLHFLKKNREQMKRRMNLNTTVVRCCVCNKSIEVLQKLVKNDKKFFCKDEYCYSLIRKSYLKEDLIEGFDLNDYEYLNRLAYDLCVKYNRIKAKAIFYKNLSFHRIKSCPAFISDFRIRQILLGDDVFDKNDYELTRDGKYYMYLKDPYLLQNLKRLYPEYEQFLKTYYPEKCATCEICKTNFIHTKFGESVNFKSTKTCSLKCYYKNFKAYSTPERSLKHSISIKKRIASGEFTPNVFNSRTCKNMILMHAEKQLKFRSSWEILFYVLYYNPDLEYETLRVPYIFENEKHTYIVDFIDKQSKIVYEIKPECNFEKDIIKAKMDALTEWCISNSYSLKTISHNEFKKFSKEHFEKLLLSNNFFIEDKQIINHINNLLCN